MPSETTPLVVVDDTVKPHSNEGVDSSYDWASSQNQSLSTLLGVTQLVLMVLLGLGTTTTHGGMEEDDDSYSPAEYVVFRDIMVMLLLGFGYLMTFLSNYGLGAVGFTLMLTTLAIQLNILVESMACRTLLIWWMDSSDADDTRFPTPVTIATLIDGEFAAATLLISFGAIIGRASPLQLVVMALCQSICYACNKAIFVFGILKAEDVGGSLTIHMFGAYFGLAVSHVLGPPQQESSNNNANKPNATSDLTALIGTTLLWVYWPSFVGATETAMPRHENACILHTVWALIGSTMAAFIVSPRLSHHHDNKLDPVHIANSTLAGGVAVGSSARLVGMTPVGALILGVVAGTVSVYGYAYSTPALEKCPWLRIYDTCGVGNLHGWPSLLGGLSSVLFILLSSSSSSGTNNGDASSSSFLVHGTGWNQCVAQLTALVCTLLVSMSSGYVTGIVMKKVGGGAHSAGIIDEYNDAVWWEGEYFENARHEKE